MRSRTKGHYFSIIAHITQVSHGSTVERREVLTIATAAVIGDYLYIDGGEITTWNGTGDGYQEDTFYYGDGNITTLTGTGIRRPYSTSSTCPN